MLQVVLDIATVLLRVLISVYAVIIVYHCFAAMRRQRRPEAPLIMLYDCLSGEKIPILFWENSIGRNRGSDIRLADPTVSRDHCVLLRREEGWMITDTNSKSGTFVNGRQVTKRQLIYIDDKICIGSSEFVLLRRTELEEEKPNSWYFSRAKDKPSMKSSNLMILITFCHLFMAVSASFAYDKQDFTPMTVFAGFTIISWVFFFVSTVIIKRVNFELEALGIFLCGTGVLLLVHNDVKQAYVQMIASLAGMIFFLFLIKFIENPDRIAGWHTIIMVMAVLMLAINIIFGKVQYGAANWITIGSVSIQPSELVKVAYIFVGAGTLDQLQTNKNLIVFIIFSGVCVAMLAFMGDFGTALIFFVTFLLISFMRSGDFRMLILALVGAALGGTIILQFKPYIADRFSAWGKVWEFEQSAGFQQARVLTNTASGGLFGVGIGNGYLKYYFAAASDLVFGVLSEELGLVVSVTIAIAIGALVFYTRAITTRSRSTFYSISACCAAGLLICQMSLNIFGSTDLLPLTGVTLPFISQGGSSVISCWGLLAFMKAADERTYAIKRGDNR